jgi:hypothetical protein
MKELDRGPKGVDERNLTESNENDDDREPNCKPFEIMTEQPTWLPDACFEKTELQETHKDTEEAVPLIIAKLTKEKPIRPPALRPASPKPTPTTVTLACPLDGPFVRPPTLLATAAS